MSVWLLKLLVIPMKKTMPTHLVKVFRNGRQLLVLSLVGYVVTAASIATAAPVVSPVERFMASLDTDATIPGEVKMILKETWAKCTDCDEAEFLAQALVSVNATFRQALDAYDAGDYLGCAKLADTLNNHANLFVRANAAAFRVKALVAADRLLDAGVAIDKLFEDGGADLTAMTYFGSEMSFLRGYCLLGNLEYDAAEAALNGFLQDSPDAPQRLVVSAQQILAELATRQAGRIGEVVDLMHYSKRRLVVTDSSGSVQQRQQRIVDILSSLIEEAEKKENSKGGGEGAGGGKSGKSQGNAPSSPMQQSTLPGGSSKEDGRLRNARHANPADTWGSLAPAKREQILQALRDSFPARYRQLVEQYYEELAKKR